MEFFIRNLISEFDHQLYEEKEETLYLQMDAFCMEILCGIMAAELRQMVICKIEKIVNL